MKKSLFRLNIKIFFSLILLFVSIFLFIKFSPVAAQEAVDLFAGEGDALQEVTGFSDASLGVVIGNIINIVLGILGFIVVGIIIYAGILWMTAGGDEKKVTDAKKWLLNGVIGLVIVMTSWVIASFIINSLNDAVNDTVSGGGYGSGSVYSGSYSNLHGGALGRVIQTHYPNRDADGIARNTKIFVSFYEAIDIESIRLPNGNIDTDLIKIYPNADADDYLSGSEDALIEVALEISEDNKTIRFSPSEYLGSPSEDVSYVVWLSNDIQKLSGGSIFGDGAYYFWRFTTATVIDETAPQVLKVTPVDPAGGCLGGCQARNRIVQIKFNEAVDPLTVSGSTSNAFNNIILGQGLDIDGVWYSANNYLMAVFIPDSLCDGVSENSCGDPVFCLPANSEFNNTIHAATLLDDGTAAALYPYDGVVDLAGNSLDGNASGIAEGKIIDDYAWVFTTNDEMRVVPPRIQAMSPGIDSENVPPDATVGITFSSPLLSLSIAKSVEVYEAEYNSSGIVEASYRWNGPQRISLDLLNGNLLLWEHYLNFNVADESDDSFIFVPRVLSKIKDEYQNCFQPAQGPGCTTSDWENGPWNEGSVNGNFPVCDRAQD